MDIHRQVSLAKFLIVGWKFYPKLGVKDARRIKEGTNVKAEMKCFPERYHYLSTP
jgi:hypothetical protein